MKIIRTAAEYKKQLEAFEKVKRQTFECPGCYTTKVHSYLKEIKGIESIWQGNHYYCTCHRCGTIWETDETE